MKDKAESRGSSQGTTQSGKKSQQKESRLTNQGGSGNRAGFSPGRPDQDMHENPSPHGRDQTTQQSGSHTSTTGTGSGQALQQTHDNANAGRSRQGGATGPGNQN